MSTIMSSTESSECLKCSTTIAQLRREVDKLSYLAEEQAKLEAAENKLVTNTEGLESKMIDTEAKLAAALAEAEQSSRSTQCHTIPTATNFHNFKHIHIW